MALAVFAGTPTARAVVVLSGAANNSAPVGKPFFNNIGVVNSASGIYLGDGWVLTAAHVAGSLPASANFGGTNYGTVAGSYTRLQNPGGIGLTALTDLAMFRLSADPGLPAVTIAGSSPTVGADAVMIGRGRNQAASVTYWDVVVGPGSSDDVWTEVAAGTPGIDHQGFKTLTNRTIRWGENQVADTGLVSNYVVFGQAIDVLTFTTAFDLGAKLHEAQAIAGDSGGGVWVDDGGNWTLAGVMLTVSVFEKQPAQTAVVGNQTSMADLSAYRSQILAVIPEPDVMTVSLVGAVLLMAFSRRRERAACG